MRKRAGFGCTDESARLGACVHTPRTTMTQSTSIFHMKLKVKVRLSPYFTQNVRVGVENLLNKALLKHVPEAGGILLAYENLELVDKVGTVVHEGCETHFSIRCDALVFRVRRNTLLSGVINKVSSSHIGLLVHGLFNASIAQEELRYGVSFDADKDAWVCEDAEGNEVQYKVGTNMLFQAIGLRSKAGLASIAGTMKLTEQNLSAASSLEKSESERQATNDMSNIGSSDDEAAGEDSDSAGGDGAVLETPQNKKARGSKTPKSSKKKKKKKSKEKSAKKDKHSKKAKSAKKDKKKRKRKLDAVE